jgi:basic amino acid/polyamine antiporter, APA family
VLLVTWVVLIGIRETARFNTALVIVKLAIVVFFLGLGAMYIRPENWTPFAPNGLKGISSAAAIIFFAYIGFDAVSTAAEESKNPQRDMPIGILGSLAICTVLYIVVSAVLTGMTSYTRFVDDSAAIATAVEVSHKPWVEAVVSAGALAGMTSVLLVFQMGQPRIFMSMARDGLLPSWAAKIHPRFRTPHVTTIITGVAVGVPAMFVDINDMIEFTNIGTLAAFALVSAGVIVLRYTEPDRPRPFRCPLVPTVPILSIVCCIALMLQLPQKTWIRFVAWMAIGLVIYFAYGIRKSRLARA